MIEKTTDYDQFIFRADNREKIDASHLNKLIESIKSRNLLELRPILVNGQMEIIDGQHRVMAAKELGVEIYYEKQKKLKPEDIVRMNISKSWTMGDHLNFYIHHGYPEYIKLAEFMKKHNLSLKVALNIVIGKVQSGYNEFKAGEFKFTEEALDTELDICWDTIAYIKKVNGYSPYTSSGRFWIAMLKMVRHENFDREKWHSNLQKKVENITCKSSCRDYLITLQQIYNFRNGGTRVSLIEETV